jgi:TolB protein
VVFSRHSDVYSVGLDGSGLRRLTATYADERAPIVSPTGRQIVFECANYMRKGIEYGNEHICSIRPDGSHRRDLTPRLEGGQEAFDPDFSPTGRVIAFSVGERPRFVRIRLDDPKHPRPLGDQFLGRAPAWAPAG